MTLMREWIKDIVRPNKAPGGNKIQNRFFIGSWIVFVLIGLSTPDTILRDHAWARLFCDFMSSFVPQIDRVAAIGLKEEVNRFHYSLLWAVSPLYFLIILLSTNKNIERGYAHMSMERIVATYVGCTLAIGFTMFLWIGIGNVGIGFTDPNNRVVRLSFHYSLSRSILAPVMVGAFWGSVALIILATKTLVTSDLMKRNWRRINDKR